MRAKKLGVFVVFLLISILVFPITVLAANDTLRLGQQNQPVDNIYFKESIKGSLKNRSEINFVLPKGVTFTSLPEIKVVSGDLEIDSIADGTSSEGRDYVLVTIKSESTTPSTIRMSNIELTVNRSVPMGPLYLELSGNAITETSSDFLGEDIMKVQLGEVIGASTDMSVVFKVGSQIYYQNGNPKVMDAIPYIKGNRTFVPLRFLMNTLGIDEKDITFLNGKVIFYQGPKKIELAIGSNKLIVDGKTILMDVAPEDQNGRVMLPVRAIAEVLEAQIDFVEDKIIITKK